MRCHYCKKTVFGFQPITVPGIGPAHATCYKSNLVTERIFEGINLADLDSDKFGELKELVKREHKARSQDAIDA